MARCNCSCVCRRKRDYILYTSSENYIRYPFWYYDRCLDDIYLPDGITSICDVMRMCNCINNNNNLNVVDIAIVDIAIAA